MKNPYWETEEFENLVSKSLISLYEKNIQKECIKVPKFIKPNENDLQQLRKFGVYFPAKNRLVMIKKIDIENDGLPKEASWGYDPTELYEGNKKDDLLKGEYFRFGYLRKIDNAPPGILNKQGLKYFGNVTMYKLLYFSATQNEGFHLMKSYVYINSKGEIYDTYARKNDGKLITTAHGMFNPDIGDISDISWTGAIIGFYQDKKHLWNVTANEGIAKATFGVYPEEVKSLFYAREMPMTETGRKRPILHWVAAHQRRLKNGIDVDIEKHLRGINEFVYNGTKFIITSPIKNKNI